jgi:NAD(P)-dependent dehydrogenase (short-subunit alcohol dehydrogenase family)
MKDVAGKVAVITGAASGIGRGMAEAFTAAGMKVVLSDIEKVALESTAVALRATGADVHTVVADVSKAEQVNALAEQTIKKYGAVHVLCNNAGISTTGSAAWSSTLDDWNWVLGVNLMGVVHGVRAFIPIMIAQGSEAHVVNTASLAGLLCGENTLYAVTKAAVVALSEGIFVDLQRQGSKTKISVLCPGYVDTNIMNAARNRPPELGEASAPPSGVIADTFRDWFAEQLKGGLDPRAVGDQVLASIREERFYILTHPGWNSLIEERVKRIVSGQNPEGARPPGFESLIERITASSRAAAEKS